MDFSYEEQLRGLIKLKVQKMPEHQNLSEYLESIRGNVLEKLRVIEQQFERPAVDEETLYSYWENARREYIHTKGSRLGGPSFADREGYETWLTEDRLGKIKWDYTDRYVKLLKKSGRSDDVVKKIELSSLDILKRLGDPHSSEPFLRKGMAVGEVQSGKTGNFNAVINRAIDSGYRLVIVLSGIMEDLRRQTQLRIETDVIGEGTTNVDRLEWGPKGVGIIKPFIQSPGEHIRQAIATTSYKSDFNVRLLDSGFSLNQTNILVCKKNVSILANIINAFRNWQQNDERHAVPFLLLDDEADNASLNNLGSKGRAYASKVNGHIRALLDLFDRKTYLGYTATPFANLLQDHNEASNLGWVIPHKTADGKEERVFSQVPNLFPDDFIVKLDSPSNYVGAKQIFETVEAPNNELGEKLPIVRLVSDDTEHFPVKVLKDSFPPEGVVNFQNKADWNARVGELERFEDFDSYDDYKKRTRAATVADDFPRRLPDSLKEAVQAFLLSTAVRESRDASMRSSSLHQPHNTMLIHVSRFRSWQNKTKDLVDKYRKELTHRIHNESPGAPDSIYEELRLVWNRHHEKLVTSIAGYLPPGYTDDYMVPIVFDAVIKFLPKLINDVEVRAINSDTGDSLSYTKSQPKKVIAVGGNRLSRGFTLEGLTVNYFVRTTNYSDTLFQMGRWFGYRAGFLDCCLLFTTEDSVDKFNSTTRCVEELEAEFEKHGMRPKDYQFKVRTHPGVLQITRPNMLRNTERKKGSFQDKLEMTTQFDVRPEKIRAVWDTFLQQICPLFHERESQGFFKATLTGEEMLHLLACENNFSSFTLDLLQEYISSCNERGYLTDWNVLIKCSGDASPAVAKGVLRAEETQLPGDIKMAIRRGPRDGVDKIMFLSDQKFKATSRSANIMTSPMDMRVAANLSQARYDEAIKKYRDLMEKKLKRDFPDLTDDEFEKELDGKLKRPPERVFREELDESTGVLIIYLFDSHYVFRQAGVAQKDPDYAEEVRAKNHDLDIPLVGLALGFPPIANDPAGDYVYRPYVLESEEQEEYEEEDLPEDSVEEVLN